MKKFIFTTAIVAAMAMTPAMADDLEDHCVAVTNESGGDASGCACLAESAEGDVRDELLAVASEADIAALSDAANEVLATCWPDA